MSKTRLESADRIGLCCNTIDAIKAKNRECIMTKTSHTATLPPALHQLIEAFAALPGIGPRSATRLAFYILRSPESIALQLAHALQEVKRAVRLCDTCFNLANSEQCAICTDITRDRRVICIVEDPLDIIALERARVYRGMYHVLHGLLSPMDDHEPVRQRIQALLARLRAAEAEGQSVREIILAINPTPEGEMTIRWLAQQLGAFTSLRLTRLALGLPVGSDLELADEHTLARALEGRQQ